MQDWYPLAKQHRLPADHFLPGNGLPKNLIVPHITEGTTAAGAIATFEASKPEPEGTGRTSVQFVIDRDGTVYQLVAISNIAWHASQVNAHAIGIEHVALSAKGAADLNAEFAAKIASGHQRPWVPLAATPEQYAASAKLIKWLCGEVGIPCDRLHIRTHNEASPRDGHVLCCTGALNPDQLVAQAVALKEVTTT